MSKTPWALYKEENYTSGKLVALRLGYSSPDLYSYVKLVRLKELLKKLNLRFGR